MRINPVKNIITAFHITLLLLAAQMAQGSAMQRGEHIRVELISLEPALTLGQTSKVGIHLIPDPGWHVYWVNPGDTGLTPQVQWQAPSELTLGPLEWGYPEAIPVAHLMNYGFHELLLPVSVTVAKDTALKSVKLGSKISWLVCKESCIPGDAQLDINLPIHAEYNPTAVNTQTANLFERWQSKVPTVLATMGASAKIADSAITLEIFARQRAFAAAETVEVFVENLDLVRYQQPLKHTWKHNHMIWTQALNDYYTTSPETVNAVIVINKQQAYRVAIPVTKNANI